MGDCAANVYSNSLALCSHPASCGPEIPTSTMLPTSELMPRRVVPHFDGLPSAALNRTTPAAIIQAATRGDSATPSNHVANQHHPRDAERLVDPGQGGTGKRATQGQLR